MAILNNKLWTDPVLVAFSSVPLKGIFRHQNDAWMKVQDANGYYNAVNLDTAVVQSLGNSELVEEFDADIVPHTES